MKTENEISNDITKLTLGIQEDFPELSKYISEMPITIPNMANPEITADNLKEYNDSLNELVTNYSKNTKWTSCKIGRSLKIMKTILIALDYDPNAPKVAEIGFSLCGNENTAITLLHIIADPSYYTSAIYDSVMGFGGYINMDLQQLNTEDELKKTSLEFIEKIKHHLGDDTITTMVKEGSTASSILNVAKEINADIIVMGSHSRRWLEDIVMGSITAQVLRHTTIPVFVIPTKKHN